MNYLQQDFPVCDRPYLAVAQTLGLSEEDVLSRLQRLLDDGVLTRFGPLYHAQRMGGALTLAAMKVPDAQFEQIAHIVNAFPEVAHNYARQHSFNMWFVLATETPDQLDATLTLIAQKTGLAVYNMPKLKEYFVRLLLEA
jgi:DNA-binding Lrp family transcriptional regulator